MSGEIESASGLAAYKGIDISVRQPVPARPLANDHTPTLARRRAHIWPEAHDPCDIGTAEVDERAGGNPVGNPHGPR